MPLSKVVSFLESMKGSPEGKKFLLCVYHAVLDSRINNAKIREYLEKLTAGEDISSLLLSSRPFKYNGKLINMFAFSTFIRSYIGERDKELYSVKTEEQIGSMMPEEITEYFEDIDKDDLQYGMQIGNPANEYIWVTDELESIDSPENLGLESNTYRIAIVFPKKDRDLYKPTVVEAYRNKAPDGNEWFFANIDPLADWGCAINIAALRSTISVAHDYSSISGSNEALIKKESLTEDHTPFLVSSGIRHEGYRDEKSAFGLFTSNEYNGRIISNIVSAIKEEEYDYKD